jgi:hypothetical protein
MNRALFTLFFAMLLSACGGTPPPADWKMNAVSLLEHAQQRWLEGDSKSADLALTKTRSEIAKSGRIDLLARAELASCAVHIASLEFTACTAFDKLEPDASASDKAYARFLRGNWTGFEAKALPAHYADLIGAKDDANANRAAVEIKEPLPRLIAAALLFQSGRVMPETLNTAVDTASERGWRRPLLALLGVQLKRAQAAGDMGAAAQLQRRIDLALGTARIQ